MNEFTDKNEMELSVRAANCLNNANITTIGQLAMKTEAEMLKLGLSFGMKFESGLVEPPMDIAPARS